MVRLEKTQLPPSLSLSILRTLITFPVNVNFSHTVFYIELGPKTGEMLIAFWCGDLRKRNHLEYLGVDSRIILKWIFKKWDEEAWTGLVWLGKEQVSGACECGNEPSGYIKGWEFLD
jgi:hypothetical protein